MKYEEIHTHRYQYRRMGLVPIKDTAPDNNHRKGGFILIILVIAMAVAPAILGLN